ncbi:MAG: hypothetical protein NTX24_01320 [Candidatus Pacearchaeota archaeon]|nr:hypothetical protein [Candidatus Pacearchaeota archaeon]
MESQCHLMAHKAWMLVLLGVLILINATWPIVSWTLFTGFIAIIFGILILIFHGCGCKNCACEAKQVIKRR